MSVLDLPRLWRPETHQALFRRILDVAARPGQIADLSDLLDGRPAALAALATFCDNTQTLADLTGGLSASDLAFLDVGTAPVETAGFILASGAGAPACSASPSPSAPWPAPGPSPPACRCCSWPRAATGTRCWCCPA